MKQKIWLWVLIFLMLFGGCGSSSPADLSTSTPAIAATQTETPIRYHVIDGTTTVFMPDEDFPIVCIYVESQKIAEHYDWGLKVAYSAEYTSGLSCIRLEETELDNWTERYPTK